ncbi:hypothetical protein B0H10DRAFT_1964552 [Mycena sp. CBHHK59/15]|nr:hypothetical protein B0H10DRAFT_1964552 [Mycena sp. CBHHK59/15]
MRKRKTQSDGQLIWPEDVETALLQGLGLHKKYDKVADHTKITRTVKQIGSWVQTARLHRDPRLPDVHRGVKYRPYGSASGSRVSLASGHLDPSGDLAGDGAGSGREIPRIDGNVITFASAPIGQTSGNGHMATFPPHISDVEAPAGNATGGYVQLISDLLHSLPTTHHHHLSRPHMTQLTTLREPYRLLPKVILNQVVSEADRISAPAPAAPTRPSTTTERQSPASLSARDHVLPPPFERPINNASGEPPASRLDAPVTHQLYPVEVVGRAAAVLGFPFPAPNVNTSPEIYAGHDVAPSRDALDQFDLCFAAPAGASTTTSLDADPSFFLNQFSPAHITTKYGHVEPCSTAPSDDAGPAPSPRLPSYSSPERAYGQFISNLDKALGKMYCATESFIVEFQGQTRMLLFFATQKGEITTTRLHPRREDIQIFTFWRGYSGPTPGIQQCVDVYPFIIKELCGVDGDISGIKKLVLVALGEQWKPLICHGDRVHSPEIPSRCAVTSCQCTRGRRVCALTLHWPFRRVLAARRVGGVRWKVGEE